ncbi:hypothetical protein CC78DRAFT_581711 [Lojkania enalia]|uniref:Uncharacterized protein n=1 Tax=Lojkania enalia TaxID=147567 RepID=A0A9P4K8C3_9PLEO|nr:hypothetical protein CC78DRAFT_581711 [Didymosphaeria enalia]
MSIREFAIHDKKNGVAFCRTLLLAAQPPIRHEILIATEKIGAVLQAPSVVVTPAPSVESASAMLEKRQSPDAISLAQVLLTAVPESIRQIAATNVPAVSSILWREFLDDRRPEWFNELPWDIQSYLIEQFGPETAAPPPILSSIASADPSMTISDGLGSSVVVSATNGPVETSGMETSQVQETSRVETSQVEETSVVETSQALTKSVIESPPTSQHSGSSDSIESTAFPSSPSSMSTRLAAPSGTPSSTMPAAPTVASNSSGLSRQQKIGIGIGVPFSVLGSAALLFGLCVFLRRRRRKSVDGSVPPSSPGFIPRFAFQEKQGDSSGERRPLRDSNNSLYDLSNMNWDDDVIEPLNNHTMNDSQMASGYQTGNVQGLVMAPALFHTHSSNRARGRRTSYTSLHSVAEVSEPDEMESPVLPRQSPQGKSPTWSTSVVPPLPAAAKIKRKPVASPGEQSPAAQAASQTLLRQTMGESSTSSRSGNHSSETVSPYVSPIEEQHQNNPFRSNHSYVEDYGPEYHHNTYIDVEDGLYGGHTSLSRYPELQKSRTEWPLRNSTRHKRTRSPLWDRVYEG